MVTLRPWLVPGTVDRVSLAWQSAHGHVAMDESTHWVLEDRLEELDDASGCLARYASSFFRQVVYAGLLKYFQLGSFIFRTGFFGGGDIALARSSASYCAVLL